MTESEKLWLEEQERHGWVMPSAPWWKRIPIVRHIRGAIARFRVDRAAAQWQQVGICLGRPSQFDLWVCYGIIRGWERPND